MFLCYDASNKRELQLYRAQSYIAKDRLRTAYIKRANDMIKRSVKRTKQNLNLKALICTTMTQLEQMILSFFSIK